MGQLVERATTRPRSRWFRLVTSALDAHGTRFLPEGGDLSEHRQNPIVVWNHGTSTRKDGTPPDPRHAIGTVAEYDQTPAALDILVEFDTEPLADLIWRKVEKGIIRACSLGAIPTEVEERNEDGVKVPVFTRWILKEASVCMLGSNPEAMALTRELEALTRTPSFAGISMVCLYPDAESRERLNQATPPGVDPDEYHVTLAAFDDEGQPEGWQERVHQVVATLAKEQVVVQGEVGGLGRFTLDGSDAMYASIDSKRIHLLRDRLMDGFSWGDVQPKPRDNHAFTPHITLAYLAPDELLPTNRLPRIPMRFPSVSFKTGGVRSDYDLLAPDAVIEARSIQDVGVAPSPLLETKIVAEVPLPTVEEVAPAEVPTVEETAVTGVVPHAEYPTVNGVWDAPAAVVRWARWASSDGSGRAETMDWAKYAGCFLWFDPARPESFEAYKLPHHDVVDGKPVTVWRGVVACAVALSVGRGVPAEDLDLCREHLARHYHEFGRKAPWELGAVDRTVAARIALAERLERSNEGARRPILRNIERLRSQSAASLGGGDGELTVRDLARGGDLYLNTYTTDSARGANEDRKMPKLNREQIADCRGLIGHKLATAELHAMVYDALPMDASALRAMHRDMAMSACREAQELHNAYVTMADGHFEPDGDEVMRAAPAVKDEELCRELKNAFSAVGPLPRELASVTRELLGTVDAGQVQAKLAGLIDDRADLATLRTQARSASAAANDARRAELIAHHTGTGVITPARAQEMRGLDPATGEKRGEPWSVTRIESYVAERSASGPLVDLQQRSTLSGAAGAQPLQPGGEAPVNPANAQQNLLDKTRHLVRLAGEVRSAPNVTVEALASRVNNASRMPGSQASVLDVNSVYEHLRSGIPASTGSSAGVPLEKA